MREVTTTYGRTPGGFIWAVVQPLATILVLGFAFSLLSRTPAMGTSFILFKATGLLAFGMFKGISNVIGRSLSYSAPLLAYPGVTWADAVLARFILNVLVEAVVAIIILTGIIMVEGLTLIYDWGSIFLAMSLAALLGLGIGVLNCFLFGRIDIWANVWGILTAPLMIVSGALIPYEDLPTMAQEVLWYNPVMHVTGLMRQGFYSTYEAQYVSIPFMLTCAMVPMVLGLILLRRHHRALLAR